MNLYSQIGVLLIRGTERPDKWSFKYFIYTYTKINNQCQLNDKYDNHASKTYDNTKNQLNVVGNTMPLGYLSPTTCLSHAFFIVMQFPRPLIATNCKKRFH